MFTKIKVVINKKTQKFDTFSRLNTKIIMYKKFISFVSLYWKSEFLVCPAHKKIMIALLCDNIAQIREIEKFEKSIIARSTPWL